MPSRWHGKQTRHARACFACSCSCGCRGSVQAAQSLSARGPAHPRPRDEACECTGVQRESLAPRSLRASPERVHCAHGRRYIRPGGRSPSRAQQGTCPHACPLQGFLPLGTLSWWGRRGLHKPVPDCLALCWPFNNTLVSCWAQPLLKVTIKWQQLWHLLAPHSAQLKGLVASQRGGLERPPVC